ncbi:hypothetical protein [uncultured Lamprocystis sp.]|jgi:hypothetical protein|uniref:hypothetical protein n=1 Tax=uncultured Lamprocystis sp. TaxID=543132 RepID=UPI0025EA8197|nr:hypothetical protein [uncultured Lamprocystis sp.]
MLEDLARQDGRGIRPIALYQAERKDGTVTPEAIRTHLIKHEGIAEDAIAIATGTERGIDGVDLFLPECKIRHIITVQALKEGWDCAWAYVLCSVANIRSPKDIEQLLGRVLRMPNAQASRFDPLNRAYAHVTHGAFQTTAKQLRDALVTLGFDREQAQEAVQTPFHFDEDDDLLAARRGTSVVLPGAPPNLDGLPGSDLAGIAITRQSAQSTTLCIQPEASPAAIDRLCERLPANQRQPVRDAYRQAVALRCPAERGETLTLPLLAWRQGELILGEATAEELRHHGRFSARDCPPHDCDWGHHERDRRGRGRTSGDFRRQDSPVAPTRLGRAMGSGLAGLLAAQHGAASAQFPAAVPIRARGLVLSRLPGAPDGHAPVGDGVQGRLSGALRQSQATNGPGLAAGNERTRGVPVDRRFGRDVAGAQHRATDTGGVARGLGCAHHAIRPPRAGVWWLTMARYRLRP